MDYTTKGWLLLAAGIVIRYIIAGRRFRRRGWGGLQHYPSFARAVITTFFEWVFKWVAILMILAGLLHLLAGLSRSDKTRKAQQEQATKK